MPLNVASRSPTPALANFLSPLTMLPTRQPFGGPMQHAHPDGDAAIRQTDSDAAIARFSAVQKQYFTDPFIRPLLARGAHLQPSRPPLINVGTYVRSEAIDKLVDEWIQLSAQEHKKCQIVSLGAGSDTRFWRIAVRFDLSQTCRTCARLSILSPQADQFQS